MFKHATLPALLTALACAAGAGHALAKEGNATAAEATAMVKKAVGFMKASGKDKGYAEISTNFHESRATHP